MVLTFESVDEILKCDHLNKSHIEQYLPVVLYIMLHKAWCSKIKLNLKYNSNE